MKSQILSFVFHLENLLKYDLLEDAVRGKVKLPAMKGKLGVAAGNFMRKLKEGAEIASSLEFLEGFVKDFRFFRKMLGLSPEKSHLVKILSFFRSYLTKDIEAERKIFQIILYPAFLLILTGALFSYVSFYFLPELAALLMVTEGLGGSDPGQYIDVSQTMTWVFWIGLVALAVAGFVLPRQKLAKVPIIGGWMRDRENLRVFSMLEIGLHHNANLQDMGEILGISASDPRKFFSEIADRTGEDSFRLLESTDERALTILEFAIAETKSKIERTENYLTEFLGPVLLLVIGVILIGFLYLVFSPVLGGGMG